MNRTLGALFSVLLLLVVGGAVGAHLRATRPVRPTPRAAPAAPHPAARPADRLAAELRDTTLVVRRRGQKQLEVHADRVSLSSDQRYAVFSGIVRASLNLRGRVALSLRATEVVLDRQRNDLRIRGPLEITSAQGYRLTAPEASWDAAQGRLVLPRGLEMEAGGSTIRASRLTVDLATESLLLEGDVQVTFKLAGGGP